MRQTTWIYPQRSCRMAGAELPPRARAMAAASSPATVLACTHARKSRSGSRSRWCRSTRRAPDSPTQLLSLFSDITWPPSGPKPCACRQTDALDWISAIRDAIILRQLDTRLADPASRHIALLYIDLDCFKIVNDVQPAPAMDHGRGQCEISDLVAQRGLIAPAATNCRPVLTTIQP